MPELMFAAMWDGSALIPARGHSARIAKELGAGEVVTLEIVADRSAASHRHYFASINSGWQNLPEDLGDRFPTPEHLRKFLLIKTGYAVSQTHACASRAEALRLAKLASALADFSVVTTDDATVTIWTAKSQSVRAMGKAEFMKSKQAVLDALDDLIGVARGETEKNAREQTQ